MSIGLCSWQKLAYAPAALLTKTRNTQVGVYRQKLVVEAADTMQLLNGGG